MSFEELIIELKEDISNIDDLINEEDDYDENKLKEKLDILTNNSTEFSRKVLLMLFKYVTR